MMTTRETAEAVKLADDSRHVVLNHLRQWADERFRVACGLVRSTTIQRQKWQQRGRAEILRDLLHHLDSMEEEAMLAAEGAGKEDEPRTAIELKNFPIEFEGQRWLATGRLMAKEAP